MTITQKTEAGTSKGVVLLVAAMASFLTPFMSSGVNVALPTISRELEVSAIALSWVATAYLLAAAIVLLPTGRLADLHGRKRVFAAGVMVYTLSSLLAAVSRSGGALIAARLVEGSGAAMIFGTGTAMLTSAFPPQERGQALGINVATVYLGLSLGPSLGGFLTEALGWRSVFLVNVPLGVLILALVAWKLKGEWAEARGEAFDLPGAIIYGLGLTGLMLGLSQLPEISGVVLILAGAAGMLLFGVWETRITSPMLNLRLFRGNRSFTFSSLAALINYCATAGVGYLLSLYLQTIKGMSPREAGLVLIAQPVMQALFSPLAGRLSDRVEPRIVASIGMGLTAAGLFTLTGLGEGTALSAILLSLVLLGLGFAFFSSPNTNAIMSSVERRFYGVASGIVGTMRLIGQTTSMGIVTLVAALLIGRVQLTPAQYPLFLDSARIDFTILAALSVLGIFASLARGQLRPALAKGE
jgi:EmrB/QacA subfamily drug resistance transporter